MWSSSLRPLYSSRHLFCKCRHTIKCRLRGFNEPGLRQFWQLFNICPVGQTHSHDGVYIWQFSVRKTLSIRRHQPVGPGGTQRRRFPFQRGKFMHAPYIIFLLSSPSLWSSNTHVWVFCLCLCGFLLLLLFLLIFLGGVCSSIARNESSLNQTHPYSLFRQEPDLRRGGANIRSWVISGPFIQFDHQIVQTSI